MSIPAPAPRGPSFRGATRGTWNTGGPSGPATRTVALGRGGLFAKGISWDDRKKAVRLSDLLLAVALVVLVAATTMPLAAAHRTLSWGPRERVIVQAYPGASALAQTAVREAGGTVGRRIGIIHGFVARVPEGMLPALRRTPGVRAITPDASVQMQADSWDSIGGSPGSMLNTAKVIGATDYWNWGYRGRGVDIALIDTGVVPVKGLTTTGKVVNGADLSFEASSPDLRYLDTYGHGTHMAGIIAGRDSDFLADGTWRGIAPGARIVNVKVGAGNGVTDVSQVIAAIDWVVQHRYDNGMNIRVLNLSFGTDGTQDYTLDPLTYAAEVAWRKGIVVVVSAGNTGFGNAKLNNPAYDPYVIAVGANNTNGTYGTADDETPEWSTRGDGVRNPDLVAPGKSIISLRAPGSYVDVHHPDARVGDRFMKGSGTSEAAAVVSGAAALILQQRPWATPDQVKALMMQTAAPLPVADPVAQGAGELDLHAALWTPTPKAVQTWPTATGTGSLERARGSLHVIGPDGSTLSGEQDIFGKPWDGLSWSGLSWSGLSWSGGTWNGSEWTGLSWSGLSWSGLSWSGLSWSGLSWSGLSWSGLSWSGAFWDGLSWSGLSWSGLSWSGFSWSGLSWSGLSWSSSCWSCGDPDAPSTEAPATEAPATDAPTTEAPATDAPTEAPATDAPTEAPATDAPTTDAPAPDATPADAPAPDATPADAPAPDATPTDAA